MINSNKKQITIAGMGKSGLSVADYLSSAGISFDCCDDNDDYPNCINAIKHHGYIIKSPGMPAEAMPISVSNQTLNDVELFLRIARRPVIMVTGTNGKSTVVSMLEHMFRACGVDAVACGNNGIPVLQAYAGKHDLYILELSSYQLENIASFPSVSSVVLNIGIDHVDRYRDMAEYEAVKQKIYSSSMVSVFPVSREGDIEYRMGIRGYVAASVKGKVTYSLDPGEVLKNDKLYCKTSDITLPGQHNHINICAALALIDVFEFEDNSLIQAINSFAGLPHRMEIVCKDSHGYVWINDSKSTNVHSLWAALSSQTMPVCLIMGGRGKGEDYSQVLKKFSPVIGRLIAYGEDGGLIISQALSISDRVAVKTVSEAVAEASSYKGDVIFSPACASFDQYSDFVERGNDFKQQVKSVVTC